MNPGNMVHDPISVISLGTALAWLGGETQVPAVASQTMPGMQLAAVSSA